jgi:hypothetical protein
MKDDTRPSALERLSSAVNTTDLTVDADHRTDADFIIALGIAGSRHSRVASPMMRLHVNGTNTNLRAAFESVLSLVKRLNAKRNWRLAGRSVDTVALQALSHHVNPTCPRCHGRKFELQDGTPVLSTKACLSCFGSGRRTVQKKFREEISHVISTLEQIDSTTERAVARLVR